MVRKKVLNHILRNRLKSICELELSRDSIAVARQI